MTYPFHGHDKGLVIEGPDTGFAERPMTAAELAAREPALKIARDIYRHANQAGVCYVEIWRTIADSYSSVEQQSARVAHNHEVEGANPSAATTPDPIAVIERLGFGDNS